MALTLPYPSMDFVPLDILTASELDQMVANIEYIASGSVFPISATNIASNAITTAKIADNAVTSSKIDFTTLGFANYSLSEVDTGFTWIDGKKIYKKTVEYTSGIQAGNNVISHGISGLVMVVNREIFGYRSSDNTTAPFPMYASTNEIGNWTINPTSIQINSTFAWADPVYITLYYTKSA